MIANSPLARRRGLTLTEALVAMFVAAIGMISLLALFPLGALQMGQALKDARSTETATNAEALMRSYWKINVLEAATPDPFVTAFGPAVGLSNPVFIDPVGVAARSITDPTRTNIASSTGPSRRTLSPTVGPAIPVFRFCSLLDDMTFDAAGAPVVTGGRVERAGRYNWMAVLQRANHDIQYEANLTVLVFDGRSVGYVAPNSELVYGDPANTNRTHSFIAGGTSIQLRFLPADARPQVGKGRWLALFTPATRLLTFHRVASLTEDASVAAQTRFDIELQTPIPAGHDPAACRAIVFAGLAEVFERAPLTAH